MLFCFFFEQKTAYEMRISDWSSDVCSSDLDSGKERRPGPRHRNSPDDADASAVTHDESAAYRLRFRFERLLATSRGYDDSATLPAAPPLGLLPRSAYAAPSEKSSKSTRWPKSGLTCCSVRPFAPLPVCIKDLTADIFQIGRAHV